MATHAVEATLLLAFPMPARLRARRSAAGSGLLKADPSGCITGSKPEITAGSLQRRAIQNYRPRLGECGLARFEALGRDAERDLIRSLARRLAENTPEASELRAAVSKSIAGNPQKPGGDPCCIASFAPGRRRSRAMSSSRSLRNRFWHDYRHGATRICSSPR
jgi:hypothetical protein